MNIYRSVPSLSVFLLLALSSAAQQAPAPRVINLTSTDGTKLKATYFDAASRVPGVILLHQ